MCENKVHFWLFGVPVWPFNRLDQVIARKIVSAAAAIYGSNYEICTHLPIIRTMWGGGGVRFNNQTVTIFPPN